jgi:ABC-2 type transport system ATP-binding protein
LVKTFGATRALDGLDLVVPRGSVLGLLGPNGAGKTTAVRVLSTLLRADSGRAEVAGVDVARDPQRVRQMIGLTGQFAAVDEYLTGRENLRMFGRLFHLSRADAARRADDLLDRFDLADAGSRLAKTYSGGMRRRLDIASSLIAAPLVLFLDEPTTGLDPRSRLGMWDVIRDLVRDGTTILLTTQYLEEADALADSIAVIDAGRVIARGTARGTEGPGRRHPARGRRRRPVGAGGGAGRAERVRPRSGERRRRRAAGVGPRPQRHQRPGRGGPATGRIRGRDRRPGAAPPDPGRRFSQVDRTCR